jgi:DNA gyrase/topoisomerase IV subunit A
MDEQTWVTKGLYTFDDDKRTITITELPTGTWTKDYKAFLDEILDADEKKSKEAKKDSKKAETASTRSSKDEVEPCGLKSFDDLYNDVDVRFVLYFTEEGYESIKENTDKFEKQFKLTSSWKTTNMTCFDTDFNIVKYKTIGDIIEAFVLKRLPMYEARRQNLIQTLESQMRELDAKRRFIQSIIEEKLVLYRKSEEEIVAGLKACDIPALSNLEKPDEYDSYDYVLRMRMDRVKQSAIDELQKQWEDKHAEKERMEAETSSSLWLADLEEFRLAGVKYEQERHNSSSESGADKSKPIKKSKPKVAAK